MAKLSQVFELIGNNDDSVYSYSNIEVSCGIIQNYDRKLEIVMVQKHTMIGQQETLTV